MLKVISYVILLLLPINLIVKSYIVKNKVVINKKTKLRVSPVEIPESSKKLYNDQMAAWARRSQLEYEMLPKGSELLAPVIKKSALPSGTGFSSKSSQLSDAKQLCQVLEKDGVVRINNCLSSQTCRELRSYVLAEQASAKQDVLDGKSPAQSRFGVEIERKFRSDLLLSMLRPNPKDGTDIGHPVVQAFNELLGKSGKMRSLYEQLVGLNGELYELAATITDPQSERQMLHPDLPYNKIPPLYVVFAALQPVSMAMGPTTFLIGTHATTTIETWNNQIKKDQLIKQSNPRYATLGTGDAVVFDARIIHCGNANDPVEGSTRALFNFSFRNPKVKGDLGYKGSIRPKYEKKLNLSDVFKHLDQFTNNNPDPFLSYGDGL